MTQSKRTLMEQLHRTCAGGDVLYLLGSKKLQSTAHWKILQEYVSWQPDSTPMFLQAETVMDRFITAVSMGTVDAYRSLLRHCPLLVLRNLDFAAGKVHLCEFLYEILEDRRRCDLPVILSGTRLPEEIPRLDNRLLRLLRQADLCDLNRDGVFACADQEAQPICRTLSFGPADRDFFAVLRLMDAETGLWPKGTLLRENCALWFRPEGRAEGLKIISTDPRYTKSLYWLAEYELPLRLDGIFSEEHFYISAIVLMGKEEEDLFEFASVEEVPSSPELEDVDPTSYRFFRDEATALEKLDHTPRDLERLIRYLDRRDSRQAYHKLFYTYGTQLDEDTKERMLARVLTMYGRIP